MAIDTEKLTDLKNLMYVAAGSMDDNFTDEPGSWEGGEEITASKLNRIDNGITKATTGINDLANMVSDLDARNTTESNNVNTIGQRLNKIDGNESYTGRTIQQINTELNQAIGADGNILTLQAKLASISNSIPNQNEIQTQINAALVENSAIQEIKLAHRAGNDFVSPPAELDSLKSRFQDIEAVLRSKTNQSNGANLNDRFVAIENAIQTITGNDVNASSLIGLQNQINALKEDLGNYLKLDTETGEQLYLDLAGRLTYIDNSISNIVDNIIGSAPSDSSQSATGEVFTAISSLSESMGLLAENLGTPSGDNVIATGLNAKVEALQESIDPNNSASLSSRISTLETSLGQASDDTTNPATPASGLYATIETLQTSKANSADLATVATSGEYNDLLNKPTIPVKVSDLTDDSGHYTKPAGGIPASDLAETYLKSDSDTITDLDGRITTLEGKDTEILTPERFGLIIPNAENSTKDYLIGPDNNGQYVYYRIIETDTDTYTKVPISSTGNGTGTSSGEFITIEHIADAETRLNNLQEKDENTDYFVGNPTEGYVHYRFTKNNNNVLAPIAIANYVNTDYIKTYDMRRVTEKDPQTQEVTGEYLELYEFNYGESNNLEEFIPQSYHRRISLPIGGSGSGTSSDEICLVANKMPRAQVLSKSEVSTILLQYVYQGYTQDVVGKQEQIATYTLTKGTQVIATNEVSSVSANIAATDLVNASPNIIIDVTDYCTDNVKNTFTLTIIQNKMRKVYIATVEIIDLQINSNFNNNTIYTTTTNITIPVSLTGPTSTSKTLYVTVDNTNEPLIINNVDASYNIPLGTLAAGTHSIAIYFKQLIGSNQEPSSSNTLYYDIICKDEQNDNQIYISSSSRIQTLELKRYETLHIPYYLYVPNKGIAKIKITDSNIDNTIIEEHSTGAYEYVFKAVNLRNSPSQYTVTIGNIVEGSETLNPSITVNITVINNDYIIEPVIENLIFDFNPLGYSNNVLNEEDKYWTNKVSGHTNIKLSIPDGATFDWANGGWKYDTIHEAPYFCIKAGSRAQLNYSLFPQDLEDNGAEFKCTFKATAVRDPEAVFLTSLDNTKRTITQYDSNMNNSDQDPEKENTLFSKYISVKEGIVITVDDKSKPSEKIVVVDIPTNGIATSNATYFMSNDAFDNALTSAKNKAEAKNTTAYVKNILSMEYLTSYNGSDAEALHNLLTENNLSKLNLDSTLTTLNESATYEEFRASDAYTSLMDNEIKQLKKNYKYTYDTSIRYNYGEFNNQAILANTSFINEFTKLETVRVTTIKEEDEQTVEQNYEIDLSYTKDGQNTIYNGISIVRPIISESQESTGLEMRAHRSNISLNSGILTYPYSEDDIIEFEYNIHKPIEGKRNSFILMYEDGVPSASMLYTTGANNLEQTTPGNIIIGSDDCDIWIYRMKFYNKELTNQEILKNFYADALTSDQMLDRYNKNTSTYISSFDPDSITPQSIAKACPNLRVIMIEAPNLTSGKNSFIKNTKIRCIYKNGRPEDNWVAYNAYHAGQGTSSDAYGAAGRNLDIMFGFNGVDQLIAPKAKNNYRFDSNYKSILITGVENNYDEIGELSDYISAMANAAEVSVETITNEENYTVNNWHLYQNGTGKVSFTENSVPNNWFNIKLNIASSENANNALLQKRYDRYLPYRDKVPAMNINNKVKNDMEFFNTVVFLKETGTPTEFINDNGANRSWHFYGIGNIGDSKKTDDTRINIPGDPNEFCVEVSDNGLLLSGFRSGVYYTDEGHETTTYTAASNQDIKYPITEEEWNNENNAVRLALSDLKEDGGWEQSLEFRYDISTKDGNTIADSDAEKALAKERQDHNKEMFNAMYHWVVTTEHFERDLDQWFIKESPLYWYLFTERYTMIDSRAKNTFYHFGKIYITESEASGANIATLEAALESATGEVNIAKAQTALDIANYIKDHASNFIIDNDAAAINNGYRFEMWDYDNDTALGINNNGKMVFDAGLEDVDKLKASWVYNEATNVLWRRIREECNSELKRVYTPLRSECFNAENLIEEFDTWQEQFPENLWRMDFERKYQRPYLEANEVRYLRDMANGRKKYQRREFERNMAVYIDSKYMATESYDAKDFIQFRPTNAQHPNQNKIISITLYSPMYINYAIGNQDMTTISSTSQTRGQAGQTYDFDFSKGITDMQNIQSRIFNASRIKAIKGLENYYADDIGLSTATKLREITLGTDYVRDKNGVILKDTNNNDIVYVNNNTSTLVFGGGNPILEKIDITNCVALANELNLSECISLKTLIATGSSITTPIFAKNGLLSAIYVSSSITNLLFDNLYLFNTINATGYNNLTSLISINSPNYDSLTIVQNSLNKLTTLKLNDINWTFNNLSEVEPFANLQKKLGNEMLLQGKITITGNWSQVKLDSYKQTFGINNIIWNTSSDTQVIEYKLRFYADESDIVTNSDANALYISYVSPPIGSNTATIGNDPVYINAISMPSKAATVSTEYIFGSFSVSPYYSWSGWHIRNSTVTLSNSTSIQSDIDFIAVFDSRARQYPLYWFLEKTNETLNTINAINTEVPMVSYGSSYETKIAPTVLDIKLLGKNTAVLGQNGAYKIFTGWEKEPINLDSTFLQDTTNGLAFCIFGAWESGTVNINDLNSQTFNEPKNLLLLSSLDESDPGNNFAICTPITIEMGQDYANGITIIGDRASEAIGPGGQIYDGSIQNGAQFGPAVVFRSNTGGSIEPALRATNLTPCADMINRGFTLAVDYRFDDDYISSQYSNGYVILGGCYEYLDGNTSQGFAIYYDCAEKISKVCFGNLNNSNTYSSSTYSHPISNVNNKDGRNIVVIRHQANSDTLEVYSGITGSNFLTSLQDNNFSQSLQWSKNNSSAPLCFGHFTTNTFNALSTVHSGIGGTVYWAKYWNEDLGHNACVQLASWPHEKLTFAVQDYSNNEVRDVINTTSQNIILSCLQASQYGGYVCALYPNNSSARGAQVSWGTTNLNSSNNSIYKTIANNRFFLGLPIKLQSVVSETLSNAAVIELEYGMSSSYKFQTGQSTKDYVFLPSYIEVGGTDTNYRTEAFTSMPWYNSANIRIVAYSGNNFDFNNTTSNNASKYMNIRAFMVPINISNNTIYTNYTGTTPVYSKINNGTNTIKRGDIFVYTVESQSGTITTNTYVYADANDVHNGAPVVSATQGSVLYCPIGGWVKSKAWWTRSAAATDSTATQNPFFFIDDQGEIAQRTLPQGWFVYEFGI